MPPTFLPINLQFLGAARETSYGTAIAAPAFWIPIDPSSTAYKPNINPLTDTYARGQMSGEYAQVQGMRNDTLSYKTYLYLDSVYQHFLAVFGRADVVTGSGPYLHKTALENGAAV